MEVAGLSGCYQLSPKFFLILNVDTRGPIVDILGPNVDEVSPNVGSKIWTVQMWTLWVQIRTHWVQNVNTLGSNSGLTRFNERPNRSNSSQTRSRIWDHLGATWSKQVHVVAFWGLVKQHQPHTYPVPLSSMVLAEVCLDWMTTRL